MRGGEGGSAPPNPPETGPRGGGGPPKIFGKNAKKGLENGKNGAEGAVLAKIWEFWKILANFRPPKFETYQRACVNVIDCDGILWCWLSIRYYEVAGNGNESTRDCRKR